jgi:hypothetical protein
MTHDPYTAPAAPLAEAGAPRNADPVAMYTPGQVGIGTFLGGPVAAVYFLRANFVALGDRDRARNTLLFGIVLLVVLGAVLPFLPDNFPNTPISMGLTFGAYYYAEHNQMKKEAILESPDHYAHSGWRVFGLGMLCLVGTLVVVAVPLMALYYFGVLA